MSDNDELPWPHCLGSFDEESCRYLLNNLGKRIVPFYPFSFGMEEVYTAIVERYGISECTDAIAVLQELLEDEQNAGGIGDDGDIWRSWRHGWRHRNDDLSNPFIPRVGNRILPSPTTSRIRRLKAANFIQYQCSARVQEDGQVEDDHIANPDILGHNIRATHCGVEEPYVDRSNVFCSKARNVSAMPALDDLVKSKEYLRTSKSGIMDDEARNFLRTTRFPMHLSPELYSGESQFLALRGGNFHTATTAYPRDSLDSSGRGLIGPGAPVVSQNPTHRPRADSSPFSGALEHSQGICEHTIDSGELGHGLQWSRGSNTGGPLDQDTVTNFTAGKHSNTERIVGVATSTSQPGTTSSSGNKRRTVNRQARLVNGTIFTSCTRKPHVVARARADTDETPRESESRYSASSKIAGRKETHRLSWVQGLREILHRETSGLTQGARQKRRSAPIHPASTYSNSMTMAPPSPPRPKNTLLSTPQSSSSEPHAHFGLDGTSDDTSSFSSSFNLNKPLPLNPEDAVRSLSNRASVASPAISSKPPSSTASLASSTFSGLWNRSDNIGRAQEFPDSTISGLHELPPITEDRISGWTACDPPKSPEPPISPKSYKKFASRNPWEDIQTPRGSIAALLHPLCETADTGEEKNKQRGIPMSYSEPRLQYAPFDHQQVFEPIPLRLEKHTKRRQGETSDVRGREQQSVSLHPQESKRYETPPKRSRSPVKRFLGLSKSESSNAIMVNESPARPKTPTSKKNSIKKWGDRLRYGFLTADQDHIRQEELIEQHMSNLDTPPSLKSTFPVSLEPPHQAKAHSEMELIITVTANRYLLKEARAGRLSAESVSRLKDHWHSIGRPQVIEFHYDQLTQHGLIVANLKTVHFHGDAAKDPLQINSSLHGWKMMAKDMSVRTLCDPDSVIRKHLHDGHRVLELLGAPFVTFLAFDDMQVKTLARISARQKDRMARKAGSAHGRSYSDGSRAASGVSRRNFSDGSHDFQYTAESFQMDKINLAPSPTPTPKMKPRKPTGAENAIMAIPLPMPMMRTRPYESRVADQYDESRGGRLGKSIREKPEDLLL